MTSAQPNDVRVLLVTGGHPFECAPLLDVFDSMPGVDCEHVEQPAALDRIRPGVVDADAVVFYDMPGITFTRSDPPVEFTSPPSGYLDGLRTMIADGVGMVFVHHAIASWPATDEFAELVGARFHYQPGSLRGVEYPDSGYVFDVTHSVEVLVPEHPICAGVPDRFEITDELYLFPAFESDITPLMRTGHDMVDSGFDSADAAIRRGHGAAAPNWSHPVGTSAVAWTKPVGDREIAYLQFGDGPQTYADPIFRRVLANAIDWSISAHLLSHRIRALGDPGPLR